MKAKEYAKQLIDANYSPEAVHQFAKDLVNEVSIILKARNCQTASAVNSVFLELDQKYRAVCKIVNKNENIIREHGFKELIQELYRGSPLIYTIDYLKNKED